jgi:hypothetical protein
LDGKAPWQRLFFVIPRARGQDSQSMLIVTPTLANARRAIALVKPLFSRFLSVNGR